MPGGEGWRWRRSTGTAGGGGVVNDAGADGVRVAGQARSRGGRGRGGGRCEAALEPVPGRALGVEQVADVRAGHAGQVAGFGVAVVRAVVVDRVRVVDDGADAVRIGLTDGAASGCRSRHGLSGGGVFGGPWVWPETRFSAPGVEGPKTVLKLLGKRTLSLLFRRRPLFLCDSVPTPGAPGRFGRPAAGSFRSKTLEDEVGELGQGDLPIAQLGAPLGGGHSDHPGDETSSESRDQHQPLVIRKRRGVHDIPREFDAAVRGVDVLTARPGRTGEPPTKFRRRNRKRGRHLKIHPTSVARYGQDQSPARAGSSSAFGCLRGFDSGLGGLLAGAHFS